MVFVRFGEKKHVEQFQKEGLIYMNTFGFFKGLEDREKGDPDENITLIAQPKNFVLTIDNIDIPATDFVGPVKLSLNNSDYTHIFCMSFLAAGTEFYDCKIFNDKVRDFGDTMLIITHPKDFINRLNFAIEPLIERNIIDSARAQRVEYVDFGSYSGDIGPFKKHTFFEHQREWRLCLQTQKDKEPFSFKMGSIADISKIIPVCNFKNKIIELPDGKHQFYFS
ncbi:MAG: hypothetical protein PHE78_05130 [Candidatus Gastranaerophilales bacterium]|nr:hypothetical protein [Candidatus Gastranaerophilales bacterium]